MPNVFNEQTRELCRAILSLRDIDELELFLSDAFTVKEILEISQRVAVARMLHEGCVYTEIAQKTGASTATISRVNKCLQYGDGGYNLILSRMEQHNDAGEISK